TNVRVEVEYVSHRNIAASRGLLDTALMQFMPHSVAPVYLDGELLWEPPFQGQVTASFRNVDHPVDLIYTPHSEPATIPKYVENITDCIVRGAYSPETRLLVEALHLFGLNTKELHVE